MPVASATEGRVLIAFADGPLEPAPTWTRIDDTENQVSRIEITAGKQTELDKSDTNHATVFMNDTTGVFSHFTGTYAGAMDGKQIMLQVQNPLNGFWYTRFRGLIDEWFYDVNPATVDGISILANVQIVCVGIFDYIAGYQLLPGVNGDIPPTGSESNIFYEDAEVDARIIQILGEVGVDSTRYVVFSGNVNVQETLYDPGDSALVALRDAADAETPAALANIYEDRFGRFVFHGRQARIDPEGVIAGGPVAATTWDFGSWNIGDGNAIAGDSTYAQIREPFTFRVSRSKIINAALCYPRGVDRTTISTLVVQDLTSQTDFGVHTFPVYDDSINNGHKTNGETASEDLVRSSQYLVQNFKDPLLRVESVAVKSLEPDDDRAASTWPVLCLADISDRAHIQVGYPPDQFSAGVANDYFIEGWQQTITPLNTEFDMVELALNVSPAATVDTYDDA